MLKQNKYEIGVESLKSKKKGEGKEKKRLKGIAKHAVNKPNGEKKFGGLLRK